MLRLSYSLSGKPLASRASRIWVGSHLLALIVLAPSTTPAQRPPAITSVRHADTVKEIQSLDWVGLYEQLEPYRRWWKETAACAGIPLDTARIDSVQFYYINAVDFEPMPTDKPGRMVYGVTYAASEQIFLSVLRVRNEIIAKHEMLHQILYWWGEQDWGNETRNEFVKCALDRPGERASSRSASPVN